MEEPRPDNLALADADRCIGHTLGTEIGGIAKNCSEKNRRSADRIVGAQVGEQIDEAGPGVNFGQQIGDVDLRHSVEDQPFCRFHLCFWHFGALFRNSENAIGKPHSSKFSGARLIIQPLQLEVQFSLFFSNPCIGIAG